MNAKEIYDSIRTRREGKLSLRWRLMLLVLAELMVSALVAYGLYHLLHRWIPLQETLLLFLAMLVISILIGTLVTNFVAKYIFSPIRHLRRAMEKVANGDYTVRLEDRNSPNEIQEVYSGFNMMTEELQNTEILQTDFVSSVSHEFKTPITAIEGYSTLLQGSDNLTPTQQQHVEKILFNSQRLSTLVGSILLLSKLENQAIPTGRAMYRLDEQIRQSIVALEPAWEERETEFDVELEVIHYNGNESTMHHVWDNLIGNAIKFGPQGGLVTVRLWQQGEKVLFSVADQGPGLSDSTKKHMFEKFYQGDSSHKQAGNGLGLALVKHILDLSNGEITAENLPDGGCRFTVTLNRMP